MLGVDPEWILSASGIAERRFAAPSESVAGLAGEAARDCLAAAGLSANEIDLLLVASGSAERRFPGPAAAVGMALGIPGTPAIDLPLASAGSLFGLAVAAGLCGKYRHILVIGAEIMSRIIDFAPDAKDVAILFGDGAGACLVSAESGGARVIDWLLASDGEFAPALELNFESPLKMDGRTVILQAARKLPRAIRDLAERNQVALPDIGAFLLHQANRNLTARVAHALGVSESRIFQNVGRYGNTSSASLLIAACEWWRCAGPSSGAPIVFAAFGAGLNWGALLAAPCQDSDAPSRDTAKEG